MAQYDINLREYWRILKKRKLTVILTALLLGAFTIIFAILRAPTPLYTSVCSIKFEKDTTVEGLYARTLSWGGGDDIETQISLLKSYSVMRKVAEKLGKIPHSKAGEEAAPGSRTAAVVEALQSKVKVSRETFTNIINIEVTDTDPVFAQKLAAEIATTYKDVHTKAQNARTTEALKYISQQLKDVRENLREAENEFNKFTQENQLVSIDLQSEALLSTAKEIRDKLRELDEAKADLSSLLGKLESFIEEGAGSSDDFYSAYANKQYQDANNTLVELSLKRDSLLKDYTTRHPEVIAVQRKIEENARKMAIILRLQINSIERKKNELNQELANVVRKTNELMEKKLEYNRLKRKVDSFNEMTALLERKSQEASIRKAEKPEEVTIVRPALLPTSPINPPKTAATGTMGVIIGLILGMVLAFIVETFDTSLGAIEDVEETLGIQVLGVIPHGDEKLIQEGMKEKEVKGEFAGSSSVRGRMRLVAHFVPQSMMAESFRALRTNIQFRDVEKKIKSLAITSASPQEGKSIVAANLAITMAQAGMKTLLVESDLRKPTLSKAFGVEISPGLTDVLLGNYSWEDVVKTITDIIVGKMELDEVMATPGLDNLNIITSGTMPPNPSELIDSKRLVDFIEDVKKEYDMIIFDTPPVLSTADPAILGTKVDAVLFVYMVGSISKGLLKRSTIQLAQVKCNLLGVVLNGMKAEVSPDFHDFKYYKYYYSHTEEKDKGVFPRIFGKSKRTLDKSNLREEKPNETFVPGKGESKEKKSGIMRVILLFIALGFLVVGVIWQTGILPFGTDFFKGKRVEIDKKSLPETAPGKPMKAAEHVSGDAESEQISPEIKAIKQEMETLKPSVDNVSPKTSEVAPEIVTVVRPPVAFTEKTGKGGEGISEKQAQESLKQSDSTNAEIKETTPPVSGTGAAELEVSKEVRFPYSLRNGSFRNLEKTEEAVSMLKDMGLSPYWSRVDLGEKGKWYRVFVGHFSTLEDAKEFEKAHGVPADRVLKTAYTVQVGDSTAKQELEKIALDLEKMGHSPYFIKISQTGYRLLVGAFVTKEAAQQLEHQLKEAGVNCAAVLR